MYIRPAKILLSFFLLAAICVNPLSAGTFSLRTIPKWNPSMEALDSNGESEYSLQIMEKPGRVGEKSKGKALLYSLLLPGLGDYYLGSKDRAKVFFVTEAAIWTSFIVFEVQGHLRENGYKDYAAAYAGVSGTNHSQDYYRLLTEFNSSNDYEEYIKQDGRYILYPNVDREALDSYFLTERVSDFEPWQWSSDEKRYEYRSIRKGSRLARRRAMYSIASAVANRIVSFIFTLKTAKSLDSGKVSQKGGFFLEFGYPCGKVNESFSTGVTLVRSF